MSNSSLLVGTLLVLVLGCGAIVFLLSRLSKASARQSLADAEKQFAQQQAELRQTITRLEVELKGTATELATNREALHIKAGELLQARELLARRETEAVGLSERILELQKTREQMRETFQVLSADALRGNREEFLLLARTELERAQAEAKVDLEQRQKLIESLVVPIRDGLNKNDEKLQAIEKERVESFGRLMNEMAGVASVSERLRSETVTLSRALHSTNSRGSWGELQLKRVCELAGMLEHCDFATQQTIRNEDGALRPDVVVKLPAGRTIVVDAKAPAVAFLDAAACEDPDRQNELLRAHAVAVRGHVNMLSKKSYWEQFQDAPDFVVLFLPNDAFYTAAIQHDSGLLEYAVEQRVLIATPVSLIGLLKVVALGWRQERIAESAQQVSDAGRELYDRLRKLTDHFEKMGSGLRKAIEAYNSAVGSMERSVFPQARRFEQLGANGAKPIDQLEPIEVVPRALGAADWVAGSGSVPQLPA